MPTPIKKKGMNKALPTNSMWLIRGDEGGISLLSTRPTKKAPNMPSMPTNSIRPAPKNTRQSTNTYCTTLSS